MKNIKLSISGQPNNLNIQQFVGNDENIFENYKFHINSSFENPDYWFVLESINKSSEECLIDPNHIIYLNTETSYPKDYFLSKYMRSYMNQFKFKYGCYNNFDIQYSSTFPFLPWLINNKNDGAIFTEQEKDLGYFQQLNSIKKVSNLSVICSNKTYTDDHKARLNFVYKLKEHFQNDLDWYGEGINEVNSKWDGIANYKYHIVLENESRNNLISEKLFDSYLGLAYPFYYGAPNLNEYFPKDSYAAIDIMDYKKSISVIERLILNNGYEKNFDSILKSKNLVVNDYHFLKRIINIVNELETTINSSKKIKVRIHDVNYFWKKQVSYKAKVKHFLKRKLRINVNNY
jgi:hypothetical protein